MPAFRKLALSTLYARKTFQDQIQFSMRQLHEIWHVLRFE